MFDMKEIGFDKMLEECIETQSKVVLSNAAGPDGGGWIGFAGGRAAEYEREGDSFMRKRFL